jgi:hypothetical protein
MQRLRRHVEFMLRPDERPSCDRHLRKGAGIAERFEHSLPLPSLIADVPDGAVLEQEAKLVLADHSDAGDVDEWELVRHVAVATG